jgi:hypothetical protein
MPLGGATFDGIRKTLAGGAAGLVSTTATVATTNKATIPNSSRRATKTTETALNDAANGSPGVSA